jgi:hypothetical protein
MGAFGKLMAITFAGLLAKPFSTWKAFEKGLIDEKGNIVRKPENQPERDTLSGIKNFVRKMKRLLIKVVPDSRLLGILVAAFLLKRESEEGLTAEEQQVKDILEKELTESEIDGMINHLKTIINMKIDIHSG